MLAVRCWDLFYQSLADLEEVVGSESASIIGYSSPTIEGTTVDFICPPGWVLIGSNSSIATCMGNGEWEPDPRKVATHTEEKFKMDEVVIGLQWTQENFENLYVSYN